MLRKHAPINKMHRRVNQENFTDKELNQAIMVRSEILNIFLKLNKTEERRLAYVR